MKIVSVITDARAVDRILQHLESERCKARDPFEPRAPPRPARYDFGRAGISPAGFL